MKRFARTFRTRGSKASDDHASMRGGGDCALWQLLAPAEGRGYRAGLPPPATSKAPAELLQVAARPDGCEESARFRDLKTPVHAGLSRMSSAVVMIFPSRQTESPAESSSVMGAG